MRVCLHVNTVTCRDVRDAGGRGLVWGSRTVSDSDVSNRYPAELTHEFEKS